MSGTTLDTNDLNEVLSEYGIVPESIRKAEQASLSDVHIVDGEYVLRSREWSPGCGAYLAEERGFLVRVAELTKLQVPILLPTRSGAYHVRKDDIAWTVYRRIPGYLSGTWQRLDLMKDSHIRTLFGALRDIHRLTAGRLSEFGFRRNYVQEVDRRFGDISDILSADVRDRVRGVLERIARVEERLPEDEVVYIHGDYHPGNVIFDDSETVSGLIDTDWGGTGHAFQDVAYFIMMLFRNYEKPRFVFDERKLSKYMEWYGVSEQERLLLMDFLILSIVYDVYVFKYLNQDPDRKRHFDYQLGMLGELCS